MEITHEIREYIIKDANERYSVRHNIKEDYWNVLKITENEDLPDRNSLIWFKVPDELLNNIKDIINKI